MTRMIIKQLASDYYNILIIYLDDETKLMNCMQALETCIKGCVSRGVGMGAVRATLSAHNDRAFAVSTTLKRKARARVERWLSCVETVISRVQSDINAVRQVIKDDVARSEDAAQPDMAGFLNFLRASQVCARSSAPASSSAPPCSSTSSTATTSMPSIVIPPSLMCGTKRTSTPATTTKGGFGFKLM